MLLAKNPVHEHLVAVTQNHRVLRRRRSVVLTCDRGVHRRWRYGERSHVRTDFDRDPVVRKEGTNERLEERSVHQDIHIRVNLPSLRRRHLHVVDSLLQEEGSLSRLEGHRGVAHGVEEDRVVGRSDDRDLLVVRRRAVASSDRDGNLVLSRQLIRVEHGEGELNRARHVDQLLVQEGGVIHLHGDDRVIQEGIRNLHPHRILVLTRLQLKSVRLVRSYRLRSIQVQHGVTVQLARHHHSAAVVVATVVEEMVHSYGKGECRLGLRVGQGKELAVNQPREQTIGVQENAVLKELETGGNTPERAVGVQDHLVVLGGKTQVLQEEELHPGICSAVHDLALIVENRERLVVRSLAVLLHHDGTLSQLLFRSDSEGRMRRFLGVGRRELKRQNLLSVH